MLVSTSLLVKKMYQKLKKKIETMGKNITYFYLFFIIKYENSLQNNILNYTTIIKYNV
jgi:hypothetical protein